MWARAYGAFEVYRAAAVTTTGNGSGVDLATYADLAKREMKVVVDVGTLTTTTTATVSITNSDTSGGAYTAPTYGTASAVVTAAGVVELNFRADKRWIRLENVVNATGSVPISAVGIALKREANS